MLSEMKWVRTGLTAFMAVALLSGSLAWAKKPVKPPPEPDPPPVTYTITWLDTFPDSEVEGLNSQGDVVGHAKSPGRYGGEPFAFLYTSDDGMVDLNTLLPEESGWFLRTTRDINDKGQIVGIGYLGNDDRPRAFRYTPALRDGDGNVIVPAVIEQIGPLQTDDQRSSASSINERGEVCGNSMDTLGEDHTWFFSDEIGIVPVLSGNGDQLRAKKINESAEILVTVTCSNSVSVARVVPFGNPEYFHSDGGGAGAEDMNDDGCFVGTGSFEVPKNKKRTTIENRAFRHDGTDFFDLGAGRGSEAFGINNHGDVVGMLPMEADPVRNKGFVYLESLQQLVNLNEAVAGNPDDVAFWIDPYTSQYARLINDTGVITGDLFYWGDAIVQIGFVLTPVPD